MRAFIKRVQNTVHRYDLWRPGTSFIVGVSGGADSLCLLDVLAQIAKKNRFTLHVAHVNYGLRGNDSAKDEELVRRMADTYGVGISVLRPKIRSKKNLESALRDIRYEFFEKLRKEKNFDIIAVAHNENDQAETFLMRLLRGASLEGLASIRPKSGFVIRPLIEMSRSEILMYLENRGISFREDRTNSDTIFFRNRIRKNLLPFLEKEFQPNIRRILARNASFLSEDYAFMEQVAESVVSDKRKRNAVFLSRRNLLRLPEPLLRHVLRKIIKDFMTYPPEQGLLNEIIKSIRSEKGKSQNLATRRLKLARKGDTVTLLFSDSN